MELLKRFFDTNWVNGLKIGNNGTIYFICDDGSGDKYLMALHPDLSIKWTIKNLIALPSTIHGSGGVPPFIISVSSDGLIFLSNLIIRDSIVYSTNNTIVIGADGTIHVTGPNNLSAL